MEDYCLDKNHTSGTLSIPAAKCILAAKSKKFVDPKGAQKSHWKIFGTRCIITNMKPIMFLKLVKKTAI